MSCFCSGSSGPLFSSFCSCCCWCFAPAPVLMCCCSCCSDFASLLLLFRSCFSALASMPLLSVLAPFSSDSLPPCFCSFVLGACVLLLLFCSWPPAVAPSALTSLLLLLWFWCSCCFCSFAPLPTAFASWFVALFSCYHACALLLLLRFCSMSSSFAARCFFSS